MPGIIFALMFMFSTFIVIDRELGPIEAMKESHRITHGHKWKLLGFSLLLVLINLLGAPRAGRRPAGDDPGLVAGLRACLSRAWPAARAPPDAAMIAPLAA